MALQPSITEYFATRKRPAIDDAKRSSQPSKKVMILENADGDVSIRKLVDERKNAPKIPSARRKLIYPNGPSNVVSASDANVTKKKVLRRVLFDKKISSSPQSDIRKTFGVLNGKPSSSSSIIKAKETTENCTNEVVSGNDEMKIAPKEEPVKTLEKSGVEKSNNETTELKEAPVEQTAEENSKVEFVQPPSVTTVEENLAVEKSLVSETESNTSEQKSSGSEKSTVSKAGPVVDESRTRNATTQKDTNLEKLKSRIQKSSKLNELKASLAKLNNGFANLEKIQKEKKNFSAKVQLDKFDMITFESSIPSPSKKTPIKMCMSPAKLREAAFGSPQSRRRLDMELSSAAPGPAPFVSPRKLLDSAAPLPPSTPPPSSPLKSPLKSPAFQRYQALVSEGKSALTLPFKYRSLAEVFRAIETVVSMLEKRQETTTFTKLKTSVQELLRRNLFEKHLAQIRAVNDGFYTFQYEKVHAVGSNKVQGDRYELIVKPVLSGLGQNMSPDVLLERRRQFYNCLLDKTKTHHEHFLGTLDPPLVVPRASLTRWHPDFDVDSVPDIEPAALPEPPCSSKVSTAKDVLEKARNLFTSNPRMERALQKVSEQQSTLAEPAATTHTTNTGPAVAALTTALKGIPKSLLEKVRAKQAARALEAMTRSPSQAKEAIRLTRLPEIARIVRNTFISEKKCVLTRELVLKKLSNSYREGLSFQELDSHLNLLQEKSPEWLNFCTFRKTDYVKFVKDVDMIKVMAKLETLASENSY